MKSPDKYLKLADEAIKSAGIAKNGTIESAYRGAVSSFGASIIMSGLVPTIQFYMADSASRDSDTRKIIEAIAKIVYAGNPGNAEKLKDDVMHAPGRIELNKLKIKITDAAIALKIMMRSYRFIDAAQDA